MTKLVLKTAFLLNVIFPTLLDLYYKEEIYIKTQSSIIYKAGYVFSESDMINLSKSSDFKPLIMKFISVIKTFNLTKTSCLLIINLYCTEYLTYVRKERKYLWKQLKDIIESDSNFVIFYQQYISKVTPELEKEMESAYFAFNKINKLIEENLYEV